MCTQGNCRKTIVWVSVDEKEEVVFRFGEVDGVQGEESDEPPHEESGLRPVGREFGLKYPAWLLDHGEILSMDLDDARGRLAMVMANGSVAVIEFV